MQHDNPETYYKVCTSKVKLNTYKQNTKTSYKICEHYYYYYYYYYYKFFMYSGRVSPEDSHSDYQYHDIFWRKRFEVLKS
jgi:hypothetical protein